MDLPQIHNCGYFRMMGKSDGARKNFNFISIYFWLKIKDLKQI